MKSKRSFYLTIICAFILSFNFESTVLATSFSTTTPIVIHKNLPESDSSEITPFSADIGWKFKTINGVLYKRLYNYTTREWIGDWIKV